MRDLITEVDEFRAWAGAYLPDSRSGEWECDYEAWSDLHASVVAFLESKPYSVWTVAERMAVLYAIARDNEFEYLAGVIGDRHRELLVPLAWAAIEHGERDDRWQLAKQLGRIKQADEAAENVLLALVRDEHEYVRRMALGALARISSPHTEPESLRVWERPDVDQQWARMMVLWCLHRVGSPMLEQLLVSAEQDARIHLRAYAEKVKHGIVDP